jgi:hypothetical protein
MVKVTAPIGAREWVRSSDGLGGMVQDEAALEKDLFGRCEAESGERLQTDADAPGHGTTEPPAAGPALCVVMEHGYGYGVPSLRTNRPSALELIMSMSEQVVRSFGLGEPTSR